MKKKLLMFVALLMLLSLLLFACSPSDSGTGDPDGDAPRDYVLSVGTGPAGGSWFPLGSVVCTIINEHVDGVRAAPTIGAAVVNIRTMAAGDMEMGLTNAPTDVNAMQGEAPFDKVIDNVRGMWMLYPEIHHAFALKESGITSHYDLVGKRVSPTFEGATALVMNLRIFEVYGISTEDFATTELIGYSGGAELLRDQHIDCYVLCTMPPSPPFMDVATFRDITTYGLEDDKIDELLDLYPDLAKVTIAGGTYPGQPDPINTVGYFCGMSIVKDIPADVVYDIVDAWWTHYERAMSVNPSFPNWIHPDNALHGMALPLHQGAYDWYIENGYDVPDHLLPVD